MGVIYSLRWRGSLAELMVKGDRSRNLREVLHVPSGSDGESDGARNSSQVSEVRRGGRPLELLPPLLNVRQQRQNAVPCFLGCSLLVCSFSACPRVRIFIRTLSGSTAAHTQDDAAAARVGGGVSKGRRGIILSGSLDSLDSADQKGGSGASFRCLSWYILYVGPCYM